MDTRAARCHLRAALLLMAVAAAAPAGAGEGVYTGTDAYVLCPPELVAAGTCEGFTISGTGRYVLVVQTPIEKTPPAMRGELAPGIPIPPVMPGARALILWDSLTHRSDQVWRAQSALAAFQPPLWLAGSDTALFWLVEALPADPASGLPQRERTRLFRLSADAGRAEDLGLSAALQDGVLDVTVSPTRPLALARVTQLGADADGRPLRADTLIAVGATGRPTAGVRTPGPVVQTGWSAQGLPLVSCRVPGASGGQATVQTFTLDPATGLLAPAQDVGRPADHAAAEPPGPLRLDNGQTTVGEGDAKETIPLLWLAGSGSGATRTLVAAQAEDGRLLPGNVAVVYRSRGAVWACALMRADRRAAEAARDQARKTVALTNAKQVGLAIILYAQDHGDNLPATGDIGDVTGYLGSASVMDGFVYTFAGGALAQIEAPAETELGYVSGPGGRAILYADGHAKWRPGAQPAR